MTRHPARWLALAVCSLSLPAFAASIEGLDPTQPLTTIAFGSCAHEERPQPIWDRIAETNPDLFLFLGDNVYVDKPDVPESLSEFADDYHQLLAQPAFARFQRTFPLLATWDDHDFGLNDSGREFPLKSGAKLLMLAFFNEAADSPRWRRDGVYGAWRFGPTGKTVQVILLDTRWWRDRLRANPNWRSGQDGGPYRPHDDESLTLLGEAQWSWLEEKLREPADVRLIGSSIQVVPDESGWETWSNFPHERRRLYRLIDETNAEGVVFLSGDRHHVEVSRNEDADVPYPMIDFTSSGINDPTGAAGEPNRYRVTPIYKRSHFGLIEIDWEATPAEVKLSAVGLEGDTLLEHRVTLDELRE